jgi:hypothetical protein
MHLLRAAGSDVIEQLAGHAVEAVRVDRSNSKVMGDCYVDHRKVTRSRHHVMSNADHKHSLSKLATRINIMGSNWLVPRDGVVDTQDVKFGHTLNAIGRCSAATSGSPAMRDAHSNRAVFLNYRRRRRRLTLRLSTSLAETIRAAERHL